MSNRISVVFDNETKSTKVLIDGKHIVLSSEEALHISNEILRINEENTPKFNIGDTVVRTQEGRYIRLGVIDKITKVQNGIIWLQKCGGWYDEDYFELVKTNG